MRERLDTYLTRMMPGWSRTFWQSIIREKGIAVNGTVVKKPHFSVDSTYKIDAAQALAEYEQTLSLKIQPGDHNFESLGVKVILDDPDFLVLDKPPFVTTEKIVEGFFPVHRLDKNTSGILVVAKNMRTQAALQKQWQQRQVKKEYSALLRGHLPYMRGAVEATIMRSATDRKKMTLSSSPRARYAYSAFQLKKYFTIKQSKFTLVQVFPETGRTHQIRVHFSKIGHPIVGDTLYGESKLNKKIEQFCGLTRQFLHAQKLTFVHPSTKKKVTVRSPLPHDLANCLTLMSTTKP